MSQLLILSCSQRKRPTPDLLLAIERYDGPTFRLVRRFLQQQSPPILDVYILSAKFGLISSTQSIPYYDQRMTAQHARKLQLTIIDTFRRILGNRSYDEICICAGQDYLLALDGYKGFIPTEVTTKIICGSLGRQLAELYDWLYRKPPLQQVFPVTPDHPSKVRMRGIELTLRAEDVLHLARQGLLDNPKESTNYQSWYVLVDGQQIAPKWLVSRLTGLPVSAFVTDEARKLLAQLGIEVRRV